MVTVHRASVDPGLRAEVRTQRPLHYREGARPSLDLPAHVRAGSALCWVGSRLAVVQDDVRCIAVVDPVSATVDSVVLDPGESGARQFDEGRGNKKQKLDLEACVSMTEGSSTMVIAFGSGSSPRRETLVVLEFHGEEATRIREIAAPRWYGALREHRAFAGSELNIEGAAILPNGALRLFQRGNGMAKDGLEPVNATADIDFASLLRDIARDEVTPPTIENVRQYDLGHCGDARITFTDATVHRDELLFIATAEESPDAINDGPVTGVFVGRIDSRGDVVKMARVFDPRGEPFLFKAEGLALDPRDAKTAYLVLDRDDPAIPSDLCTLTLPL